MKVMSNMLRHITHCQFTVLAYLHTQHFTRKRNEPYLSAFPAAAGTHLPTRTRRDGRLSRPWCTAKPRPRFEPTPSCRHYRTPNSVLAFITAHPRQRQSDTPIPIPIPKYYGIGDDFPGEINRTRPTSAVTSPCIVYIHNKLCGRPPQYAPAPVTLTFDLLTLKVVSESRMTWATSVPILVLIGLSILDLGQTDVRLHHRLMTPPRGQGHNNVLNSSKYIGLP